MDSTTTVYVTGPEPVTSLMNGNIPTLNVGEIGSSRFSLVLHSTLLTPVEQVDFLRSLAREAESLAVQVAALHAEPLAVQLVNAAEHRIQWERGWRAGPQRWDWLRSLCCLAKGHRWAVTSRGSQRCCGRCWIVQDRGVTA